MATGQKLTVRKLRTFSQGSIQHSRFTVRINEGQREEPHTIGEKKDLLPVTNLYKI